MRTYQRLEGQTYRQKRSYTGVSTRKIHYQGKSIKLERDLRGFAFFLKLSDSENAISICSISFHFSTLFNGVYFSIQFYSTFVKDDVG